MDDAQKPEAPGRRICIIGWYGLDSTGDEAILRQFIEGMVDAQTQLTVIAANRNRAYSLYARENIKIIEHRRLFGRGALKSWLSGKVYAQIKAVKQADLVVIGGGSLLHDRGRIRNLIQVLDEIWIAALFRRRVATFAIGVGPLNRKIARWLVSRSLRLCNVVMVRDHDCRKLLTKIGVPEALIRVVPDPGFLVKPVPVPIERMPWLQKLGSTKLIGVFLADSLDVTKERKADLIIEIASALDHLHQSIGLKYVFIPFIAQVGDDDRLMARAVVSKMTHRDSAHVAERTFEPEEVAWLVRQFHLNFTIRFHALLFSLSGGVPVVPVSYDPKITSLVNEFGLSELLVPLDTLCSRDITTAMQIVDENRSEYARHIRTEATRRADMAPTSFNILNALLFRE